MPKNIYDNDEYSNIEYNALDKLSFFVYSLSSKNEFIAPTTIAEAKSIPAKINIQTKDKVSFTLVNKDIVNQGEQLLSMERKGSNIPITTKMNVSLDIDSLIEDDPSVSIVRGYEFDYFDKAVFDAFCSLLYAGNKYITYSMIARCMSGKDSSYHPSATTINYIQKSITKMTRTEISIDYSEEFNSFQNVRERNPKEHDSLIIEDRLLNIRMVTARINGVKIKALQPVTIPSLLQYATIRRQINSFDSNILATPMNRNRVSTLCQYFLIQRICAMKSSDKISRIIPFEKIYSVCPDFEEKKKIESTYRKFIRRIHTSVCDSLKYWKEIGFIKDYKIESKGVTKYYKIHLTVEKNMTK